MITGSRYAYVALAWLFVVGLVVQVFFIGLTLFVDEKNVELHRSLGWILHLSPILVLAAAALGRVGRAQILTALALAIVVFIVPILATLRESSPVIAALHPVGAVLAFALALVVAWNAWRTVRNEAPDSGQRAPVGG
jgi:hypothetical protein